MYAASLVPGVPPRCYRYPPGHRSDQYVRFLIWKATLSKETRPWRCVTYSSDGWLIPVGFPRSAK